MTGAVRRLGVACAIFAFVLDQATKALALGFASALSGGIELLPFFNLVLVRNPGVTFGMFGTVPWWALVLLSLAIVAVLGVWLWRTRNRLLGAALGLVSGGALGNVLDRVRYGGVTDFLDFYVGAYHWPAFNLADVAVVSGMALLVFDSLSGTDRAKPVKV